MRIKTHFLLLAVFWLAGCNLPQKAIETPTTDPVATQVSLLLTQAVTPAQAEATVTSQPQLSSTLTPPVQTATQQPPTNTPPPAPTTIPILNANDPKATLGSPSWRETLDTGTAFYQYETDTTRVKMVDGALLLTGISANGWHGWSLTHSQQPLNAYLEAELIPQTCSGADLYGIVFRATDTAGYFFGVTCDGRYNLHARNFDDGSDQPIINLRQNPAIHSGADQTNRLGIIFTGEQISLYANGVLLETVNDSTFKDKGYVGAFVAANNTAEFTVRMNEIALWKLP